jgi:hypothetical protein
VVARGFRFSVGVDLTEPVREAILAVPETAWRPVLTQQDQPGRRIERLEPHRAPAALHPSRRLHRDRCEQLRTRITMSSEGV